MALLSGFKLLAGRGHHPTSSRSTSAPLRQHSSFHISCPLSVPPPSPHFHLLYVCLRHAPIGKAACCSSCYAALSASAGKSLNRQHDTRSASTRGYSRSSSLRRCVSLVSLGRVRVSGMGICCINYLARPVPCLDLEPDSSTTLSPPTGSFLTTAPHSCHRLAETLESYM